MVWTLVLAHFLADYPLQPDRMVRYKTRPEVRGLHAGILMGVMMLMVGKAVSQVWPFLLVLAAVHLVIDVGKSWLTERYPDRVNLLYISDQGIHLLSIGLTAAWIRASVGQIPQMLPKTMVVDALGLLLVSYVWLITEKVVFQKGPEAEHRIDPRAWLRLVIRTSMFAGIIWWVVPAITAAALLGTEVWPPYPTSVQGMRQLAIDLCVVAGCAGLVITSR